MPYPAPEIDYFDHLDQHDELAMETEPPTPAMTHISVSDTEGQEGQEGQGDDSTWSNHIDIVD